MFGLLERLFTPILKKQKKTCILIIRRSKA